MKKPEKRIYCIFLLLMWTLGVLCCFCFLVAVRCVIVVDAVVVIAIAIYFYVYQFLMTRSD